jgi:plastocyanin
LADPEQLYQEVLQEEQRKGSSGPVAEGRAKAARVRAEHGSPHPKEAKWWPGAQPHFEGGDGQAPAAAPPPPEAAPTEEAPAAPAEAPAAQAPAEAPAAQAEAPAAQAPAEAPAAQAEAAAAQAPAQAPAAQGSGAPPAAAQAPPQQAAAATGAQAPPATPTQLPPEQRPGGVRHGTATGTRLRPEDAVTTEAQFDGERAMRERRKLIDELVATGVPAVTAADVGRPRAPYLAVLYLLIPLVVVAFLVGQRNPTTSAEPSGGGTTSETPAGGSGGGGNFTGSDITLVAENIAFNTDQIGFPPKQDVSVTLENQDTVAHDFAIYQNEQDGQAQTNPVFRGDSVTGNASTTYEFRSPPKGGYYFQCDIHPTMNGEATVQ